ncbi:hypothetical protein DACRYDRAFT_16625 [Dacryopinax primogenitus]|uniref:Uncharacterized protein n=1 Tax=Dacryopinax primogenitus (strain DJM 731) TaxID=1858805 RepID=M5G4A1_DACPD|nr:uncharacterized protein DACRYDRAFT_16625 [Dacryopinax primogenitus]EJU00652.1 hypothetical protein DACRYDRAFT_16625 [Dacryopinax primogenitus]
MEVVGSIPHQSSTSAGTAGVKRGQTASSACESSASSDWAQVELECQIVSMMHAPKENLQPSSSKAQSVDALQSWTAVHIGQYAKEVFHMWDRIAMREQAMVLHVEQRTEMNVQYWMPKLNAFLCMYGYLNISDHHPECLQNQLSNILRDCAFLHDSGIHLPTGSLGGLDLCHVPKDIWTLSAILSDIDSQLYLPPKLWGNEPDIMQLWDCTAKWFKFLEINPWPAPVKLQFLSHQNVMKMALIMFPSDLPHNSTLLNQTYTPTCFQSYALGRVPDVSMFSKSVPLENSRQPIGLLRLLDETHSKQDDWPAAWTVLSQLVRESNTENPQGHGPKRKNVAQTVASISLYTAEAKVNPFSGGNNDDEDLDMQSEQLNTSSTAKRCRPSRRNYTAHVSVREHPIQMEVDYYSLGLFSEPAWPHLPIVNRKQLLNRQRISIYTKTMEQAGHHNVVPVFLNNPEDLSAKFIREVGVVVTNWPGECSVIFQHGPFCCQDCQGSENPESKRKGGHKKVLQVHKPNEEDKPALKSIPYSVYSQPKDMYQSGNIPALTKIWQQLSHLLGWTCPWPQTRNKKKQAAKKTKQLASPELGEAI